MNEWNLCVKYCSGRKKLGAAPPTVDEMATYVARHSNRIRRMCGVVSSQFWPEDQGQPGEQGASMPPATSAPPADSTAGDPAENPTDGPAAEPFAGPGDAGEDVHPRALEITQMLNGELTRADFQEENDFYNLQRRAKGYVLVGGVLFKIVRGNHVRVLLTKSQVERAISESHVGGGHFGRPPTLRHLTKTVWWFGNMQNDVADYIRSCDTCQRFNPAFMKVTPPMAHVAYKPQLFNLVAVDIKDLPLTPRGNRHLLVTVDYFSKYVIAMAIESKFPPVVVDALINNVFFFMGAPKMMLSDNGGEFKNELVDRIKLQFHFAQRFISPSHPQSNGLCERCNGVISVVVGKICEGHVADWDLHLPEAVFKYNTKTHSATETTPFRIVFGKDCETAVDRALGEIGAAGDLDAETRTFSEYSDDEVDRHVSQTELARIEINRYAHEHQNRANAKNKAKYDKAHRVGDSVIAVGDLVLKKVTQLSGKMHGRVAAKWEGPFEVVATTKYTVHLNQGGEIVRGVSYHILKKYHAPVAGR